ncbi:LysR family transcriptional regulator [Glaciecola sp. MH2013]|nr:LysR family transcriptional regulator [Glaciecola sp. MH2013]
MSIKQLNAFVNVAKFQSFAEAAEQLNLSQPALSSAIKNMEDFLGGELFMRSTRRVELTPEGASFLPLAKRILSDLDTAVFDVKQLFELENGVVTVAAMPSFAHSKLPKILTFFGYAQPKIGIRIIDEVMESTIQHVKDARAELGFVFSPDDTSNLHFTRLFDDDFILISPNGHELNQQLKPSLAQISKHKFIAMNRGSSTRKWVDLAFDKKGLSLDVAYEASQFETIGNLVASGLGVSIVPSMCRQQMEVKNCVCQLVDDLDITIAVGYIRSDKQTLSVAAKALIAIIDDHYLR